MKIANTMFSNKIEIDDGELFSLIIENPHLYRAFLEDIYRQANGDDGSTVISENNTPISFAKSADILDSFTPFNHNSKKMLSCINSILESKAVDEEYHLKTNSMLASIENYIADLSFDMPFRTQCDGLSVQSFIKFLKVSVADDCETLVETIIQYMKILSSLGKCNFFICIGLLGIMTDEEIAEFENEVRKQQLQVLLIDSHARNNTNNLNRLTIDNDLCEF